MFDLLVWGGTVYGAGDASGHPPARRRRCLSVGISDVVVNGEPAVRDTEFTGRLAGRAVYGPGRRR